MNILIEETWGRLVHGDCRTVLPTVASDSLDAMVTDPPAGIEFMGKDWDNPDKYGTSFASHGFSDGGDRIPAPAQKLSERNPVCKKCRKHIRGAGGCQCEEPDSDEPPEMILERRLQQRRGFIVFMESVMRESFRVLKPGAHAVVWALPRTSHWTATALENVGFEIRDCIYHVKPRSPEINTFLGSLSPEQWDLLQRCEPTDEFLLHIFGSGFPKSLNIAKALDKIARGCGQGHPDPLSPLHGKYRHQKVSGNTKNDLHGFMASLSQAEDIYVPSTSEAKLWAGWGTALKPAVEVWWIARKPIREINVATQVRKTGTGAINIDGTRVRHANPEDFEKHKIQVERQKARGGTWEGSWKNSSDVAGANDVSPMGRWPSHILLTHAPDCRRVGTREVKTGTAYEPDAGGRMSRAVYGATNTLGRECGYASEDGTETIDAWECAPGCPVRMMDDQSGETSSGAMKHEVGAYEGESVTGFLRGRSGPTNQHGDTGGASRFFQTFEHEPQGRWPSHLLLTHAPECQRTGTHVVKGHPQGPDRFQKTTGGSFSKEYGNQAAISSDEIVDTWECVPECPVRQLDEQSGDSKSVVREGGEGEALDPTQEGWRFRRASGGYTDEGGASRFFETFEHETPFVYMAKASRGERDEGIKGETKTRRAVQYGGKKQRECNVCGSRSGPSKEGQSWPTCGHNDWTWVEQLDEGHKGGNAKNTHPTVKPIKLMRYLVRLVTPKGGTVLDPFSGSGSTLLAALLEGVKFFGIEREEEYAHIAEERIQYHARVELERRSEEAGFDLLAELEQEF